MEELLTLSGISFSWPNGNLVFSDLSLSIQNAECIGLTGANGSGKSTLLSCITGLESISSGEIAFKGELIQSEKDFQQLRRHTGYALQNASNQIIFPTVLEDVVFGPINLGLEHPLEIARDTLSLLGISHLERMDSFHLSGGQLRLVALAGIIAMNPELLLLDEPFAGLDVQAAANLRNVLQNLPCSRLLVHHDPDLLTQLCDRIFLLQNGLLQEVPKVANP